MPVDKVTHYNPPNKNDRKTRDGRLLANVKWSTDPNDVNCNRCLQLMRNDKE